MLEAWHSGRALGLFLLLIILSACGGAGQAATGGDPNSPVSGPVGGGGGGAPQPPGITGQVTGPDGAAIKDVLVTPQPLDAQAAPIPEIAVISDAQGTYFWSLPAGRYRISFSHQGLQTQTIEVAIPPAPLLVRNINLAP